MKFLTLFVAVLALASCHSAEVQEALVAQGRSISSEIVDALEALKVKMEVGWPDRGIPPMAPLVIEHKKFNLDAGEFNAAGQVDNCVVSGLNEFEIVIMRVNAILSRMNFEFNFASLNVSTNYQAEVGSGYRMERDGGAFMALEDLNISGQIKYSLGVVSGKFSVKEIKIYVKVGNVVSKIENLSKYRILNRKINEVVEEFITLAINDNTDFVADWIDSTITPMANEIIGDRGLSDLLCIILGTC